MVSSPNCARCVYHVVVCCVALCASDDEHDDVARDKVKIFFFLFLLLLLFVCFIDIIYTATTTVPLDHASANLVLSISADI